MKMTSSVTRVVGALAFSATLLGASSAALAQQTINITIGASHPTTWLPIGVMAGFFKNEVDRLLREGDNRHRINWKEAYAGTLFKLQDTMEAIRDNIADVGFVGSVWEGDTMPLSNITFMTPFASGDLGLVLRTVDKFARENPALQKEWTGNNLKYLGTMGIETYHVWSKMPIARFDDLKGKRLNAPGAALQWVRGTGAVGVDGGLPTYYTNVQTGVVDGAISFYTGILPIRLHEVAPHVAEVDIGAMMGGAVAMTLDRFNKLPKEVQAAFERAGAAYVGELVKETNARIESSRKAMLDAGTKVVRFSDADRLKWAQSLPDIAGEWAKATEAKGIPARQLLQAYMQELRRGGAKPARDWDK